MNFVVFDATFAHTTICFTLIASKSAFVYIKNIIDKFKTALFCLRISLTLSREIRK